jgi:hypothetical protein
MIHQKYNWFIGDWGLLIISNLLLLLLEWDGIRVSVNILFYGSVGDQPVCVALSGEEQGQIRMGLPTRRW